MNDAVDEFIEDKKMWFRDLHKNFGEENSDDEENETEKPGDALMTLKEKEEKAAQISTEKIQRQKKSIVIYRRNQHPLICIWPQEWKHY